MKHVTVMAYGHTLCGDSWGIRRESPDFSRLYYVQGGICTYREGGEEQRLQAGHLYLMPQHRTYSMAQDASDHLLVLWQHIRVNGCNRTSFADLDISDSPEIRHLLTSLEDCSRGMEIYNTASVENRKRTECIERLLEVLLTLLENRFGTLFVPYDPRIRSIWKLLDEGGLQEATVTGMASAAGLDRSYFCRLFRRQFGITPQKWLLEKKMEAASASLLENSSVETAAETAGYLNVKSFTRAFTGYFHCSPVVYRRSHIMQP